MKYFTHIVISILITVIGGSIMLFLNKESFDVRYTLSENMPLNLGAGPQEGAQQLEVKNLSKKEVSKIHVTLPPRIIKHDIKKNSPADIIQTFPPTPGKDSFELIYPSLPPQSSFVVVVKTSGTGITKSEIKIKHDKGVAEEALADSNNSTLGWLANTLQWCSPIFWLLMGALSLRGIYIDSLASSAEYNCDVILKKKKPFYVGDEKWQEIRKKAFAKFGKSHYYGTLKPTDIKGSTIYRCLDSDKPAYFSDEEWANMIHVKSKEMLEDINAKLASFSTWVKSASIIDILKLKMPTNFPIDKWDEWQNDLQERYIEILSLEDPYYSSIVSKIKKVKPNEIDGARWEKYFNPLIAEYAAYLTTEITNLYRGDHITYLAAQDLRILDEDKVKKLKQLAYKLQLAQLPDLFWHDEAIAFLKCEKPAWLTVDDYKTRKTLAEAVVRLPEKEQLNGDITVALNSIISGVVMGSILIDKLRSAGYENLIQLNDQIRSTQESIRNKSIENEMNAKEIEKLRPQILKQLAIINELFSNPSSIERIETYDNPFSPGNFKLLQKLAKALSN